MRVDILKTYKLYINGQFPRSESGRYLPLTDARKKLLANISYASRKDFRNAVSAARSAFPAWQARAPFNKSQILYRIAEMLEGRRAQFVAELQSVSVSEKAATEEVEMCIDRIVHFAGWCDKFQQVYTSVNPVSGPFFNFSVPEPMGVVAIVAPQKPGLLGLVSTLLPVIAGGNTCVIFAGKFAPHCAISFAEVLHTSDVPAGIVNILTGDLPEVIPYMAGHMDVDAIWYVDDNQDILDDFREKSTVNFKRIAGDRPKWNSAEADLPDLIMRFQEIKTTWHPIETPHGGGNSY